MTEQLKEIKGCKGYYISETGYVVHNGRQLALGRTKSGRQNISINNGKNGSCFKTIARLVAENFLRKHPHKMHLKHKDGNLDNNCKDNLEYSYQPEFSQETIENRKKRYKENWMGKKHWKSRPFTIDGKKFYTLREATEKAGTTCLDTIKKRLMIARMKNYKYCD